MIIRMLAAGAALALLLPFALAAGALALVPVLALILGVLWMSAVHRLLARAERGRRAPERPSVPVTAAGVSPASEGRVSRDGNRSPS